MYSECGHEENIEVALAFPDTEWFQEYLNKIKAIIEKLNLNILLVRETGEIKRLGNNGMHAKFEYHLEENMKSYSPRDKTIYFFNGERYPKNRIVLEVIRQFLKDNPEITYGQLNAVFPSHIQGSKYGVFTKYENALQFQATVGNRHFLKESELLKTADGIKIAICSQWAKGKNFEEFLKKTRVLGYEITTQ